MTKKSTGVYYGWWIVATAAVGMSTGPGQFAFGSLGLFMLPLSEEFGWNRTEISLALSFFTVALALAMPVIGRLVDRFGSRKVLLPSLTAFAILLALIPLMVNQLWLLYLLFVLIGSLAAGANALPYLRSISAWFDRRRGLAIGIAMGGSGTGFVYVPPMVQYMIDNHGWRSGYFLLAAIALIAVPLVYFALRESPSPFQIAGHDELSEAAISGQAGPNIPLSALLKRMLLWQLFTIFCLLSFSLYGVLSHLVPMMSDRGMSTGSAALAMSTLGVSVVVARVVIGYIIDRFFAPFVAAGCFLVAVAGVVILATGASGPMAFFAAILIGFSMGAEIDMLAFLTGRYFGIENFGQVYGILITSFLIGTAVGPVAFGMVFEALGSYQWILITSIAFMLISTALTVFLPKYPSTKN